MREQHHLQPTSPPALDYLQQAFHNASIHENSKNSTTTTTTTSFLIVSTKEIESSPTKALFNPYAVLHTFEDEENQSTLLTMMEPQELRDLLFREPMSILLLDVRNTEDFQVNRILTSVHVAPLLVQNASSPGAIEQQLVSFEDKIYLRQREFCRVVLVNSDGSQEDIVLQRLLHMLQREGVCKQLHILNGGFCGFYLLYPQYCSQQQEASQELGAVHQLTPIERLKIAHQRLFRSFSRNIDCEPPSKVLEYIFLGSAQNSVNKYQLKNLNVTFILNTAKECKNHYPNEFVYMKCPLVDDEKEDVKKYFDESHEFIDRARKLGGRALVHCFMGMSRSAAIVLSYLMKHKQWPLKVAFKYVRDRRPIIDINLGFMKQLLAYEQALFGTSSLPSPVKRKKRSSLPKADQSSVPESL
jgi:protein-tyrosine phosphatase/rhodanese-related sulfurtransferase